MRVRRYKYRIYPDKDQQDHLDQTVFRATRFIWNYMLGYYTAMYAMLAKSPKCKQVYYNLKDASKLLTELRDSNFYPYVTDSPRDVVQQTLRQLDTAFKRARLRVSGRPRFKRWSHEQKALFPDKAFSIQDNKLKLAKLSKPIKVRWSQPLPSQPTSVTVIKTPSGQYYASFTCYVTAQTQPSSELKQDVLGIDLGLTDLAVTSDDITISNPKHYNKKLRRLQHLQRKLSGQIKGSNSYEKTRLQLAKLHQRIANQRLDFLHQLSTNLISRYIAISIESLNVSGMAKNRRLAKSIMTAGWGMFCNMLEYKIQQSNWCNLVIAHQQFPSTRLCSICQTKHYEPLDVKIREWRCTNCNNVHDRDKNAADNLRELAITFAGYWIDKPGTIFKAPLLDYPTALAPV